MYGTVDLMLDKIVNFLLVVASFVLCFMVFWHVQVARNFEIFGGELFLILIPVALGLILTRKKG